MTTLANRPNTALLVIDVQNQVVAGAWERDKVVANIRTLVEKARAEKIPVIWVQHGDDNLQKDTVGWQYVPELTRDPAEPLVHKRYGDSFEETSLAAILEKLGIGRLFVTGAQTDACIRCTIHGAFTRGYDTLLVGDAHTTEDGTEWGMPPPDKVIDHTNGYWRWQEAPGREAGVVTTAEVNFGR